MPQNIEPTTSGVPAVAHAAPAGAGVLVKALATAVLLSAVLERAWVTEDAFISFRVVDNFVNGFGLRWNVDERVQAFTHPLWVLLHIPFYRVTGEVFFTTLAISVTLTALAFVIGIRGASRPALCLVPLVALVCSKAFCDFATSGLESPLTFVFLAAFAGLLFRHAENPPIGRSFLLAALAATNRLDNVFFFLPALAFMLLRRHRRRHLRAALAGLAPLIAWEAFSLFYFGFLLPNTKYAKLDTGLPRGGYVRQGFVYAFDLLVNDPFSAAVILMATAAAIAAWRAAPLAEHRGRVLVLLVCGAWLYAAYVVSVGGDFMSGRFWAPCVFLAALILYRALELARRLGTETVATAAALLLLAAVLFPRSAYFNARPARFDSKLIDERAFYAETNTLLNYSTTRSVRDHPFSREGLAVRKQARAAGTRITWATALVGMFGFHAGPDVIVIDRIGLADPLLARLPMEDRSRFPKPGHFVRAVPPGYEEARRTGSLDALPPPLAGYYEPLRLIVSGPLLSPERLRTIVLFNFGRYDRFRDDYLRTRSGS